MELYYVPVILIVLYYSVLYYFQRTFNYWKIRNVRGPEPVTFYGNFKESILRQKNIGEIYYDIYTRYPNEKVVGIYRMTTPSLLIRDLDVIKQIMIKDFDKFLDRGVEFSKEGLGANLFHADGDTWRALRSRFTPVFTSGKLKNMFYLINDCADKFTDFVENEIRISPEQDIRNLIQRYTIASISACAFGADFDTFHGNLDTLKEVDELIFTPNYAGELDMMYPGILKKVNLSIFPKKITKFFNDLVTNVLNERNGKPTNRNDFMDLILELKAKGQIANVKDNNMLLDITQDVMAAQAFVFYAAGYETSATTMVYLFHELAKNPHVQEKLIAEIDESLLANDNKITYDSLKDMKYLEKVFNETLRMHSIVEPLQRQAGEDYKIPGTDVVVTKGQIVFISPKGIHFDEKYYPNPNVFDPERFNPEVAGTRHPCDYLPFGSGPRNCIGMRFGQIQSRLCIAKFLSKFRVEFTSNTKKILDVDPNRVIMGPKGGVYLNVFPRN